MNRKIIMKSRYRAQKGSQIDRIQKIAFARCKQNEHSCSTRSHKNTMQKLKYIITNPNDKLSQKEHQLSQYRIQKTLEGLRTLNGKVIHSTIFMEKIRRLKLNRCPCSIMLRRLSCIISQLLALHIDSRPRDNDDYEMQLQFLNKLVA